MKKIVFLLFLVAFLATGCSLRIINEPSDFFSPPEITYIETNGYIYYKTGEYKTFAEKGYYRGKFVNGIPMGIFKWYDPDGLIREKGSFKNGKREGVFQSFNKDGSLKTQSVYRDGVKIK